MHDAETRALRRAVVVLVTVSAARWGWAHARPNRAGVGGENVIEELLEESRTEMADGEARSRPLAPGERIDPNRAGEIELDRLPGIGPSTARAILAAREGGLRFRRPEDLVAVSGLGPVTVARLAPLLDFDRSPPPLPGASGSVPPSRAPPTVDLNRASTEELVTLPGIGPALAERILAERRKRMFRSLEDLERVPGIGPVTVDRLRGYASVFKGFW